MKHWPLTLATVVGCIGLSGCQQQVAQLSGLISPPIECQEAIDIAQINAIANTPSYVIYEVDYCYDGSLGMDVRINLAPADRSRFTPHGPVRAIAGRNQVTLTLVAQNFELDVDTVALSHLEVSLEHHLSQADGEIQAQKLISEVVPLTAVLHQQSATEVLLTQR